jgi:hypothetical protein
LSGPPSPFTWAVSLRREACFGRNAGGRIESGRARSCGSRALLLDTALMQDDDTVRDVLDYDMIAGDEEAAETELSLK